jgi:hypothetical protein
MTVPLSSRVPGERDTQVIAAFLQDVMEKELAKARKHSTMLQSKLDGAFAQYHNEVQDMHA